MTKIEDIERAVSSLAPAELERFRLWFDEFQAARFDTRIERDAREGELDGIVERARQDYQKALARDL